MKRRLRKKRCLGEFRELAFPLRFVVAEGVDDDACDRLIDDWLAALEREDLQFGGGGSRIWTGIVERASRGSAGEAERAFVAEWLEADDRVAEFEIGPEFDGWYGDPEPWLKPRR